MLEKDFYLMKQTFLWGVNINSLLLLLFFCFFFQDIVEVHVERTPRLPYPSMREHLNFYRQRDTDRWGRIYARIRSIQDYSARNGELLNFPMPSPSSAFTAFTAAAPTPLPDVLSPPSMSTHPVAGPSGLAPNARVPPFAITLDSSDDEALPPPEAPLSDDDDVEVVGEYKSRNQRTPELIELNSDVEMDVPTDNTTVVVADTTAEPEPEQDPFIDVVNTEELEVRPPVWEGKEEEVPSEEAPLDKKKKKHRDASPSSPGRSKHKKHKKKHKSSKSKKHSRKHFFYGVLSSDEEENPLEYVPPKIQPKSYSSSEDEELMPKIRSVVVSNSTWGSPSTSQSYYS